jgi:beta-glucosidase
VKLRAGLFEKGRPSSRPLGNRLALVGAPEHRAVAREAVRKSLVLLKNSDGLLPLRRRINVLVAGDGADDIGKQSGGWTISWQGTGNTNADFPGATSIFGGIRAAVVPAGGTATLSVDGTYRSRPDVAIVVFGENPYAEWHGDIKTVEFRAADPVDILRPAPEVSPRGAWSASRTPAAAPDESGSDSNLALVRRMRQRGVPVVAVFLTGRPRGVTAELDAANAFVVAWLPGSEGAGIADVLFRANNGAINYDFTGKLSFAWPRSAANGNANRSDIGDSPLFPYGFGLTYCIRHCDAPLSQTEWQTQPSSMSQNTPTSR